MFSEDCNRFIVKVLGVSKVGLKVNCFDGLDCDHERCKRQKFSGNAIESITSVFFYLL